MNAFSSRAVNAYARIGAETGVVSASPHQLILMLYEGAIVAIASAQQHLRLNGIAARGEAISKAISIIDGGLKASLDLNVGGELAKNLSELYQYMGRRLVQANLRNDHAGFEEVRLLLLQLKGAWETLALASAAAAVQPGRPAAVNPSPSSRVAAAHGSI
ncbi:MAG: flagellar export chaperone FliS [Betaproteobacteria bacterium]|nr:flagellar export chaperone FliS [Betaproteobacteria bacterium]